jgi:hypothetical protein
MDPAARPQSVEATTFSLPAASVNPDDAVRDEFGVLGEYWRFHLACEYQRLYPGTAQGQYTLGV